MSRPHNLHYIYPNDTSKDYLFQVEKILLTAGRII